MKWLTNINPDSVPLVYLHETYVEAMNNKKQYLKDKIISDPKATDRYTVEELKKNGDERSLH